MHCIFSRKNDVLGQRYVKAGQTKVIGMYQLKCQEGLIKTIGKIELHISEEQKLFLHHICKCRAYI